MRTREEIISAALLKEEHPKYGVLSFSKWEALVILDNKMLTPEEVSARDVAECWAVCCLGIESEEVQAAILGDKSKLKAFYEEHFPASEISSFCDWFDLEFLEADAAATKHKGKRGKAMEGPSLRLRLLGRLRSMLRLVSPEKSH